MSGSAARAPSACNRCILPRPRTDPTPAAGTPLDDVAAIRAVLVAAARSGRAMTYAGLLAALGHRFTRPRMRALLRTVGKIDNQRATAEPELAVLVVRQSDHIPGQGWWDELSHRLEYSGPATGPKAASFVRRKQRLAFDHWANTQ